MHPNYDDLILARDCERLLNALERYIQLDRHYDDRTGQLHALLLKRRNEIIEKLKGTKNVNT